MVNQDLNPLDGPLTTVLSSDTPRDRDNYPYLYIGIRVCDVKKVVPCHKANKTGRAVIQALGCLSPESMLLIFIFKDKTI